MIIFFFLSFFFFPLFSLPIWCRHREKEKVFFFFFFQLKKMCFNFKGSIHTGRLIEWKSIWRREFLILLLFYKTPRLRDKSILLIRQIKTNTRVQSIIIQTFDHVFWYKNLLSIVLKVRSLWKERAGIYFGGLNEGENLAPIGFFKNLICQSQKVFSPSVIYSSGWLLWFLGPNRH